MNSLPEIIPISKEMNEFVSGRQVQAAAKKSLLINEAAEKKSTSAELFAGILILSKEVKNRALLRVKNTILILDIGIGPEFRQRLEEFAVSESRRLYAPIAVKKVIFSPIVKAHRYHYSNLQTLTSQIVSEKMKIDVIVSECAHDALLFNLCLSEDCIFYVKMSAAASCRDLGALGVIYSCFEHSRKIGTEYLVFYGRKKISKAFMDKCSGMLGSADTGGMFTIPAELLALL